MSDILIVDSNAMIQALRLTGREFRRITLGINGLAAFTELVLTQDEEERLNEVKTLLVGLKVKFSPNAENRTDYVGRITDIRIIATHYGICPAAIVEFPDRGYSRLRGLDELINECDLSAIKEVQRLSDGITLKMINA